MGVSIHDPDYQEMIDRMAGEIEFFGVDKFDIPDLMQKLSSIMNDYGAVSYT